MKLSIFRYLDYRKLILDIFKTLPNQGRGGRKNLALALNCQMAFITHVLKGDKDLNADQALKAARHFNFKIAEIEYFMDLVSFSRAGTKELREFLIHKIKTRQREFELLQNRLEESNHLSLADQGRYYSHWLYAAVHMAATVPQFQSIDALSNYFHISKEELTDIVEFLSAIGLINLEVGHIRPRLAHVYVGSDSPFVQHHHMIWRSKVMSSLTVKPEDLQYSVCFTSSMKDWALIRETLVHAIESCLAVIRPSNAEKLGVLCLDLRPI